MSKINSEKIIAAIFWYFQCQLWFMYAKIHNKAY